MSFKVNDIVKLTKFGWSNRDPGISPGALAIVKFCSDNTACACEFFPPAKSGYLHGCGGKCANHRGRWMYEDEIELAAAPASANIAELFKEASK